jgi:hypothetical protein
MHANTEQLLNLRDGGAESAAVREHVAGCEQCREEIERLSAMRESLRALPPVRPDADLWKTLAMGAVHRPEPSRFHWGSAVAIAASFVLGLALLIRIGDDRGSPQDAPIETTPAATVSETTPAVGRATLPALQMRSRRLEALRAAMPRRPEVNRAGTAMTIADLEDRIALVDLRLNAADALDLTTEQRQALWRERVNLMQSLLQVEYAQLQSPGY